MPTDRFFDELFEYESNNEIGSKEHDEHAENLIGTYSGIDIVTTPSRRSGKPTVAGTRLEPLILSERVFGQTLEIINSLLPDPEFSQETKEYLVKHYQDHPHDVPLVIPQDESWLEYHKIDDIDYNIYGDKIETAYKLSVIEIASRRDYTFPRMIHAMCEYYDNDTKNVETMRRHSYDTRYCLTNIGDSEDPVALVEDKKDLDGYFVAEDGEKFENYADFLTYSWDGSWPPKNIVFLDHQATFGENRPPS